MRTLLFLRFSLDVDSMYISAWEARIDSHGRVFYIDHINRTTTWQRPNLTTRNTGCDLRRQQLDRRYQSVRRTISRPDNIDREVNSSNGNPFDNTERQNDRPDRSESEPFDITTIPPVLFLTRPDFFTVLHTNTDAMEVYNRNPSLKHMINRVRRDPIVFPRYEHNRDLVALINVFADPNKELPRGYESKLDRTGKVSFLIKLHRRERHRVILIIKCCDFRDFSYVTQGRLRLLLIHDYLQKLLIYERC